MTDGTAYAGSARPQIVVRPPDPTESTRRTLSQVPRSGKEEDDPNAVLKHRFLKKGGGAIFIAPSGIGKSVFAVQAAILWSMGEPMMGIAPARPLRIAVIQGEDDDDDLCEFRDDIVRELAKTHSLDSLQRACDSIALLDFTGKRGIVFTGAFKEEVDKGLYDLFIVNPLHSYFDGDLSLASDCSAFFRLGIDRAIKPDKAAVLFIHHTGKPPAAHERRVWGMDAYSEYVGNGSAELTNWPRATLVAIKHARHDGLFVLSAPKRGARLGWLDEEGRPTRRKYMVHGRDSIFWSEIGESEIGAKFGREPVRKGRPSRESEDMRLERCIGKVRELLADGPLKASELKAGFGKVADGVFVLKRLNGAEPGEYGVYRARAAQNNAMFFALDADAARTAADGYKAVRKRRSADNLTT